MPPIRISVSDPTTDQLAAIEVDSEDPIENLKALIEVEFRIPFAQQVLKFNQQTLAENQKLSAYGIAHDDLILVLRKTKKPKNPLQVEAQKILKHYESQPQTLPVLRQNNPELARLVEAKDLQGIMNFIQEMQRKQLQEKQEFAKKMMELESDPFNPENQKMIEEMISRKNIQENLDYAHEYMPENFGSVTMLYIEMTVNRHPIQAFVDSGAQSTIMSQACAERCQIMRLVDTRYQGVAMGVGTQKIIGKIHAVEIQILDQFLNCSLTILEGDSIDFLLGLDMLKRFQCSIDLAKNVLHFPSVQISVPFLGEGEIKKRISLTDEKNILDRQTKEQSEQQQPQIKQTQPQQQQPTSQSQQQQQPQQQAQQQKPAGNEAAVQTLLNMGFNRADAIKALTQFNGDVEKAAQYLMSLKFGF